MPSLTSSPSAARALACRERGLGDGHVRNVDRLAHGVLRRLALSSDRQFFASCPTDSPVVCQGALIYVDGRIYVRNNATKCYDCLSVHDLTKKFYSLPMRPKWLDQVKCPFVVLFSYFTTGSRGINFIIHCIYPDFVKSDPGLTFALTGTFLPCLYPTCETSNYKATLQEIWISPLVGDTAPPLESNQQRPALIVLRDDNTLQVYNVESGVLMASVYLGDGVKFKEMSCNQETASIVVKSTRHRPSNATSSNGAPRDGVVSFVVFRFPPLKLLVHFVLCKSVFGVSVTDASIHQNLIVVMHSDGQIKAFSLEYILENVMPDFLLMSSLPPDWMHSFQFVTNSCNLGDSISGEDVVVRSIADEVGQKPVGIPVTADVSHLPPVIFQTKSLHHYLQIGSVPWKYLVSETEGIYKVGKRGR